MMEKYSHRKNNWYPASPINLIDYIYPFPIFRFSMKSGLGKVNYGRDHPEGKKAKDRNYELKIKHANRARNDTNDNPVQKHTRPAERGYLEAQF